MQKWKIIDYIAVRIQLWAKSVVARDCRAQNLTDHWPVVMYVRLPCKKESWRKTPEHLEAEKNSRGNEGEGLKVAKRELSKQRSKCKARRILQETQKVKNKQTVCRALYCENEGGTTSDRQKWKEELEQYSRNKYQDDEMKKKAKEELDE